MSPTSTPSRSSNSRHSIASPSNRRRNSLLPSRRRARSRSPRCSTASASGTSGKTVAQGLARALRLARPRFAMPTVDDDCRRTTASARRSPPRCTSLVRRTAHRRGSSTVSLRRAWTHTDRARHRDRRRATHRQDGRAHRDAADAEPHRGRRAHRARQAARSRRRYRRRPVRSSPVTTRAANWTRRDSLASRSSMRQSSCGVSGLGRRFAPRISPAVMITYSIAPASLHRLRRRLLAAGPGVAAEILQDAGLRHRRSAQRPLARACRRAHRRGRHGAARCRLVRAPASRTLRKRRLGDAQRRRSAIARCCSARPTGPRPSPATAEHPGVLFHLRLPGRVSDCAGRRAARRARSRVPVLRRVASAASSPARRKRWRPSTTSLPPGVRGVRHSIRPNSRPDSARQPGSQVGAHDEFAALDDFAIPRQHDRLLGDECVKIRQPLPRLK